MFSHKFQIPVRIYLIYFKLCTYAYGFSCVFLIDKEMDFFLQQTNLVFLDVLKELCRG